MRTEVTIVVPGEPVGKGRPRARVQGGRIVCYSPGRTRAWERTAAQAARAAMGDDLPFTGPVAVEVVAMLGIPPSWPQWKARAALEGHIAPTTRPDEDNIGKAAKDALNGIVYLDDAQIVRSATTKLYADEPAVKVTVRRIPRAHSAVSSHREFMAMVAGR